MDSRLIPRHRGPGTLQARAGHDDAGLLCQYRGQPSRVADPQEGNAAPVGVVQVDPGPKGLGGAPVGPGRKVPQGHAGAPQVVEDHAEPRHVDRVPEHLLGQVPSTQKGSGTGFLVREQLARGRVQGVLRRRQPAAGGQAVRSHGVGVDEGLDRAQERAKILPGPQRGTEQGDRCAQRQDVDGVDELAGIDDVVVPRHGEGRLEHGLADQDGGQVLPPARVALRDAAGVVSQEVGELALVDVPGRARQGEDPDDPAVVESSGAGRTGEHRQGGHRLGGDHRVGPRAVGLGELLAPHDRRGGVGDAEGALESPGGGHAVESPPSGDLGVAQLAQEVLVRLVEERVVEAYGRGQEVEFGEHCRTPS